MEEAVKIILQSGKSGLDLALYVLLPVLVVMMALMKVLEARGVMALAAKLLQPFLKPFGIPGSGVFAILQMLFVSFAAPIATMAMMAANGINRRQVAATLAMVLTLSQANVVFPMVAAGLNLGIVMLTSIVGGLAAAALTYHVFARSLVDDQQVQVDVTPVAGSGHKTTTLNLLIVGGQEAIQAVINIIPMLIISIFVVNILKAVGGITMLETMLTPLFSMIGFPAAAVLPLATKYLAGGTSMMGVTLNLLKEGAITVQELNRMAGFITNPCDIVGVIILTPAGARYAPIVRPAVFGAAVGIILRGVMHLLIF